MIDLYIFSAERISNTYGIGTYIEQITNFFHDTEKLRLTLVHFKMGDTDDYSISEEKNYRVVTMSFKKISTIFNYKTLWSNLRKTIIQSQTDTLIFHLNHYQEIPLVYWAKRDFPNCHTIFTVHYHEWVHFNRNVNEIISLLKIPKREINDKNELIYQSYENEKNLYSKIDEIVVLSEREKLFLTEIYHLSADKIRVIPNGMQCTDTEASPKERKSIRQRLLIVADTFGLGEIVEDGINDFDVLVGFNLTKEESAELESKGSIIKGVLIEK